MQSKTRVLIVDDEPLARLLLANHLARHHDFEVVAAAGSGKEAIEALGQHQPDILFLDVQMPEMDGFDLLRAIHSPRMPYIVFVTAFDQYALQAFEVRALDYLLKPFDEERFDRALQNVRERISTTERAGLSQRVLDLLAERESRSRHAERFLVKKDGRMYFVRTEDVEWIEAQGNYVYLHTGKEKHLVRNALTALETQLDPQRFQRIQRAAIVNVDAIAELQPWFRGDMRVLLRSGAEVKLSRRYRDAFSRLAISSYQINEPPSSPDPPRK